MSRSRWPSPLRGQEEERHGSQGRPTPPRGGIAGASRRPGRRGESQWQCDPRRKSRFGRAPARNDRRATSTDGYGSHSAACCDGSVVWVNQYAVPPSEPGGTRHFDLGSALAERGWNVVIVASDLSLVSRSYSRRRGAWDLHAFEVTEGAVRFRFLWASPYRRNDWRRLASMLSFGTVTALDLAVRRSLGRSVLIGSSPHLFAAFSNTTKSRPHCGTSRPSRESTPPAAPSRSREPTALTANPPTTASSPPTIEQPHGAGRARTFIPANSVRGCLIVGFGQSP